MFPSNHVAAAAGHAATSVPAYCGSSWLNPQITTPAQWATCAKVGWGQPTTVAAQAGNAVGSHLWIVIAALIVAAVIVMIRRSVPSATAG